MARDINKLKDRLQAVKGLDSASTYNAQDEEEKKKKQAAQLKSDAHAKAVREALEKTRVSASTPKYTTYEAPLKQSVEVQTQSARDNAGKKNKEQATSGKSVTQSRKDQTTSLLANIGEALKANRSAGSDLQRQVSDLRGLTAGAANTAAKTGGWANEAAATGNELMQRWYESAGRQLTGAAASAQQRVNEMLSPASRQQEVENENAFSRLLDYWTPRTDATYRQQLTDEEKAQGSAQNAQIIADLEAKAAAGTADSTELYLLEVYKGIQKQYDAGEITERAQTGAEVEEAEASRLAAQQGYMQSRDNVNYLGRESERRIQEISGRQTVPVVLDRMQQAGASVEDYEAEREALYQDYMNAGSLKTVFKDYDLLNYTPEQYAAYRWTEENEPEKLGDLKEYLDISANAQISQDAQEYWSDPDRADGMNNIVGNTVLGITGRLSGLLNTADIALQSLAVAGGMRNSIDYNRTGWGVQGGEDAVSAQAEKLAEIGSLGDAFDSLKDTWLGDLNLGDIYRNGVDSAVSILNGGLFGKMTGLATSGQVFSGAYADAKERGASDEQAGLFAVFNSAAEGIGEQVSFGSFQNLIIGRGMDKKVGGKILLGLAQMAEEGGQEFVTEELNILADRFVLQELSQEEQQAQAYMAQGYDPDTARELAREENNERLLDAALGGIIGGAMRSGGSYAAQGISNAAGSVQTAIDDAARGSQIQKMGNAQQMAQLMGEVTGETVTPEKSKRKLGKQQREFIENAGEYVSGADEATRDIVRGKVYDVANASAEALDGTSQAAKVKAGKRSAAMKTSDTGASVGGESVTVQGFVKTAEKGSDAKLNIKKADGTLAEANMEDVTFDSKSSEVYSYAADMATPELANTFRMSIQPEQMGSIERVANGYSQAYDMARAGFKEASVRASSLTGALTDEQVSAAYKLGAEARKSAQIAAITKAAERAKANMGNAWKGGTARFDDSVVVDALDDTQKAQIDVASVFTGSMGVNVVFFESKADETGRFTRENGSYNRKTNTIYIDVNAGRYYKGDSPSKTALLRTLSHEVTHAVQRNSPEIYSELRDTVTDILGEAKGVTIEDLIDRKMAADSSLTTRDAAMDELVADACERMIEDSDAAQRLAEAHPDAAKTIFQKVGELLKKIGDDIKAAFKGRQLSTEAQLVMKDVERYQAVVDLWTKGVMQTAEVSGREHVGARVSEMETVAITEETAAEGEEVTSGEAVGLFDEAARTAEVHIDNRTWENDDVQFQARNGGTEGINWAIKEELLTKADQRVIHETLANKDFLKYYVAKTKDGKYVIPCKTVIVFGSGTYSRPVVEDVVIFNVSPQYYERAIEDAMEVLYGDERTYLGRISKYEAHEALEALLQDGLATVFSRPIRETGEATGSQRRAERNTGRKTSAGNRTGKSEESVEDTRYQTREEAISTRYAASQMEQADGRQFVDDVQYSARVTDPNTLDFLDNQETVTTYKTMQVVNGKLYPPMAAVVAGSYEDASELGTWEQATEHPELIKLDKKGKPQFVLNKGQGKGNVPAAYNPYMHSSNLVLNDQFSSAYNRPNLVTVECEVPVSELTSGYRAQYAKDAVGWHSWHTGTVAGALRKATGMERQVLLSRWIKPVRIVPDAEVARMYKDLLDGTGVAVPDNVVPPGLLRELEKIGVPITKSGKVEDNTVQYSPRGTRDEAKRNRALREGDMLNEFHKAMSKYEWKQYFYRIGSDAAYNPDLYDDGDTTTVVVEDMLLLLEMQSNGEFSVIDLYKSEAIRYNRTEFEDMDFVETWRDAGYDAKKLIRWAAAADNDVGKTIFRRYDRVQLRFVNVDASYIKAGQEGTGTGIDDIHRRRTYGKGVLESDTAEDEVSAEVNQTRDPDQISIRELLVNAIEAEVTDSEENAWLKGYRADLGKMMEKQAELDKQREELDRLTRTARQRRQEAKQRSIEYGARSGLSKTELANLSRYENIIESLSQTAKRSEMQQAALDRAQANFEFLKDKTEGRLTDEAFEDWRRQKKLSEGDPEQLLSDSAREGLQKARSRVATLSGQLARMDDGLLKLEASKPIMNIVEREREAVKKEADKRVERVRNRYATDAMRKKLSRKAASLDERLRHPKDGAYIPDELKQAAIELDQLIADMNVGYGSDPKKAAERRIDRVRRELVAMRELGTNISQVVDEDLITMLEELRKKAQDMLISEMSVEDLQDIEKAIDHVLFLSNSAYDLHIAGKNERIARAAVAQAADMEGKHTKKHKGVIALLQKLARDENLPIYFFRRLGGKFEELAQGLFDGESDFGIIAAEENALIERIKKKHNYDEWFKDGILELVPENGGRLKMNREEALMLYATHNREVTNKRQDARHLSKGGVVEKHTDPRIKDAENSSEGVKLSEGDMQTISDWLTAEQKAYADEVVAHLSGELADRLNEASRRMHGFSKFTEEYYFPYNVSGLSLPQNINEAQAKLMASVGMAKSTTAEAVKPVTMGEFTDMVTEHIRTALMYATMAPAQQDFMRLLNYQFEDEDSKTTMTEKLTDAYGEDVVKYMLTFMRDIYGRTTDKGSLDALAASMTSRFKKNAVALSASVWLQQYTSMYRAWAVIGPQYFYGKVHNPAKSWEQAKKYAGTAVMKEIGRFDTNVGRNVAEWIANKKAYTIPGRAVEISDAVTGWIPEKMDMLAWTRIWEACKREQAKALGKDTESEEVLKAAGRRMDEVTRLTQVYDSVFSKSAHMRNKGWVAKTFTNFMAESTVVVNMFVDAVLNAKKNPGQLVRTSVMLLGSTIAVNFMASFAYAWRDDDEDETYLEKYIQSVVSGFVDDLNPMNYLPVLNKIVSELKGFTGDSTEMATIADTIGYAKLALTMERGVSLEDRLLYAAHAIGAAMGIPVKNVYREVSGVIRAIKNVGNVKLREDAILNAVKYGALDGSLIATMLGISDSKEYNADQMYKAIRDGDYAEAADLRTHLINFNGAKDDKAVDSLLRTRIKDGFTAGEIGADEAIELLTGYAGMKQDDASEKVLEWQYAIDNDGSSYSDMRERYLEGEITYDDAVSDRVQYGGVESDKAKATVDKWEFERLNGYAYEDLREEHADGNVSSAEAMEIMQDYGGKDENEAYWEVTEWDYGDGWDGKGTLLNDAFASGSDTQVRSRMQELAGHSDWQKPGNELASYVTDYYKPIYEAAPAAQKDALRQTILGYLKMAYEAVGEEYYGDDYALRYRSWLKN